MKIKKWMGLLLVLLLVLPLFSGQPAKAAGRVVEVEDFSAFTAAVNDLQDGDTIRLTDHLKGEISLNKEVATIKGKYWCAFDLKKDCTVDFNDYSAEITLNTIGSTSTAYLFYVPDNKRVTFTGGKLLSNVKGESSYPYAFANFGVLTLNKMEVDLSNHWSGIRSLSQTSTTNILQSNIVGKNEWGSVGIEGGGILRDSSIRNDATDGRTLDIFRPFIIESGTISGNTAIFANDSYGLEMHELFQENADVTLNDKAWTPTTEAYVTGKVVVKPAIPPKTGFALKLDPANQMKADVADLNDVAPGSEVAVTITEPENESLEKLTANGVDVTGKVDDDVYTFNMPNKDLELKATFKADEPEKTGHALKLDPAANLKTDLKDLANIAKDTDVAVTVTPPAGKTLATLKADGVDVTNLVKEGVYTFKMPEKDMTLTATFKDVEAGFLMSVFTIDKKEMRINENGKERTEQLDIAPYIRNDRTMLPVRFVGQSLNMDVTFDEKTRDVLVKDATRSVKLNLDSNVVVTGESLKPYLLDSKPEVIQGRTMLPIGEIANILGFSRTDQNHPGGYLTWDGQTRTVTIMVQTAK